MPDILDYMFSFITDICSKINIHLIQVPHNEVFSLIKNFDFKSFVLT